MRKFLFSCMMFLLCGCDQAQIKVVDESAQPLVGAKVYAQSPSVESEAVITNQDGVATLPSLAGRATLRIEFEGYQTEFVDIKAQFPKTIQLKKLP